MTDIVIETKPKRSEPTPTPRSGDPVKTDAAAPVRSAPRPWTSLKLDPSTGERMVGKDGVTVADMPWCFDPNAGVFRFASVRMVAQQNRITGAYTKPKANGPVYEASLGYPIFTFKEVEACYDAAEAKSLPLRKACLLAKPMRGPKVTREMQRLVAAAPDVFVAPDTAEREIVERTDELDAEIERIIKGG